MKVLVTGALGFIGSHLVNELVSEGHQVWGMDDLSLGKMENMNPDAKYLVGVAGDCTRDWPILYGESVDVVFNCAVHPLPESLVNPRGTILDNIRITTLALDAIDIIRETELIHFSSSEVYGSSNEVLTERSALNPITPYAASKAACDLLVMSYVKTFGIKAKIVRPFNVIGPRQNADSYAAVIPTVIRRITERKTPYVTGDGSQTRDFTYVKDVVDGAIKVWKNGRNGEVYNLCSEKETTILDLVSTIMRLMGRDDSPARAAARAGDVDRHRGSAQKAREELGWKPKVGLEDALVATIDYQTRTA